MKDPRKVGRASLDHKHLPSMAALRNAAHRRASKHPHGGPAHDRLAAHIEALGAGKATVSSAKERARAR